MNLDNVTVTFDASEFFLLIRDFSEHLQETLGMPEDTAHLAALAAVLYFRKDAPQSLISLISINPAPPK